jgi:hypothetical protein
VNEPKLKEPKKFTWNDGDLDWEDQPGEQIDIYKDE